LSRRSFLGSRTPLRKQHLEPPSIQRDGASPPTRASACGRLVVRLTATVAEPGSGPPRSRGTPAEGSPHLTCRGVPRPPAELRAPPLL
jgi:hypothetical protein